MGILGKKIRKPNYIKTLALGGTLLRWNYENVFILTFQYSKTWVFI